MCFAGLVSTASDDRPRRAARRARPVAWMVASLLAIAALAVSWLGLEQILGPGSLAAGLGLGDPPAASASSDASAGPPQPTVAVDIATPSAPSVLVGPGHPIAPADYAPASLVPLADISLEAADGVELEHDAAYALLQLAADARYEHGFALSVARGYVAAEDQAAAYEAAVAELGEARAAREVGAPGADEHQTGFAADIALPGSDCSLEACFAETEAGAWLAEHASDYGFIVRYPIGSAAQTGVADRPFQLRYVGDELAAQIRQSGAATYEEFLGLPPVG